MHWLGLATFQSISPANFKPDFVISGFPEYKTTIKSLDAAQRLELLRAALAIVNNMSTSAPVRGIIVVGNADVALRKAQSERASFELEVSQTRADNALAVLLDEIARTSGNPAARYMFKTSRGRRRLSEPTDHQCCDRSRDAAEPPRRIRPVPGASGPATCGAR